MHHMVQKTNKIKKSFPKMHHFVQNLTCSLLYWCKQYFWRQYVHRRMHHKNMEAMARMFCNSGICHVFIL